MSDLTELQAAIRAFNDERAWEPFFTPKNLAMALNVEAGELLELFQWLTPDQSGTFGDHLERTRVEEEMADVLIYLLNLATRLDVNLIEAARNKLVKNGIKYPIVGAK